MLFDFGVGFPDLRHFRRCHKLLWLNLFTSEEALLCCRFLQIDQNLFFGVLGRLVAWVDFDTLRFQIMGEANYHILHNWVGNWGCFSNPNRRFQSILRFVDHSLGVLVAVVAFELVDHDWGSVICLTFLGWDQGQHLLALEVVCFRPFKRVLKWCFLLTCRFLLYRERSHHADIIGLDFEHRLFLLLIRHFDFKFTQLVQWDDWVVIAGVFW